MAKLKIYLFRHGETYFNRNKTFTGWKESKLTKKGIKQAKTIAKRLKNKKIEIAFQTKLSRSKDTLRYVLEYHPETREIITANRMIERSYGDLEGKDHEWAIKKYGQEKFDSWHRGWNQSPPSGESFKMVEKRVKIFIKELKAFMKKEKVNVAISAHGNSIRLFRKLMEKSSIKETCEWFIPYDKVFTYTIDV